MGWCGTGSLTRLRITPPYDITADDLMEKPASICYMQSTLLYLIKLLNYLILILRTILTLWLDYKFFQFLRWERKGLYGRGVESVAWVMHGVRSTGAMLALHRRWWGEIVGTWPTDDQWRRTLVIHAHIWSVLCHNNAFPGHLFFKFIQNISSIGKLVPTSNAWSSTPYIYDYHWYIFWFEFRFL